MNQLSFESVNLGERVESPLFTRGSSSRIHVLLNQCSIHLALLALIDGRAFFEIEEDEDRMILSSIRR